MQWTEILIPSLSPLTKNFLHRSDKSIQSLNTLLKFSFYPISDIDNQCSFWTILQKTTLFGTFLFKRFCLEPTFFFSFSNKFLRRLRLEQNWYNFLSNQCFRLLTTASKTQKFVFFIDLMPIITRKTLFAKLWKNGLCTDYRHKISTFFMIFSFFSFFCKKVIILKISHRWDDFNFTKNIDFWANSQNFESWPNELKLSQNSTTPLLSCQMGGGVV